MGFTQGPDKAFWGGRFLRGEPPWDRGGVSPQLLQWLDSGELRPCHILVPGCGTGHEVVERGSPRRIVMAANPLEDGASGGRKHDARVSRTDRRTTLA